jgi:two-component system response regulator YesN
MKEAGRMYRVMIVDDEILVRVGLKSTINWEAIGFSIVAEASNGEQAYELFNALYPDVILTDIRMPKMDGLKLTELVKAKRPITKIIILTCYDDFEYAREALKLGASNYLLKSEIEDDELVSLMRSIHEELNSEMGKIERYSILQRQISSNINELKEKLLSDLIESRVNIDEEFYSKCESLNVNLSGTSYTLGILYKTNMENFSGYTDTDWHIMDSGVINIISELLGEKGLNFLVSSTENKFILLVNTEGVNAEEFKAVIARVRDSVLKYLNISLTAIISEAFRHLSLIGSVYRECKEKSKAMFYIDGGSIAFTGALCFGKANVNELKRKYTKAIMACADEEDLDGANKIVENLENEFINMFTDPMQVKFYCIILINDLMERYHGFLCDENRSDYCSNLSNLLMNASKIGEVTGIIRHFLKEMIGAMHDNRLLNSKRIILKVVNYINSNYDKKITLKSLAAYVNLSKQYLCNIFKKETGENIFAYINRIRVEKAKEMIKKYDYKVKELFDKVGFSDQQYFCKSFKRITGMTVAEYKGELLKKVRD